MATQKGTNPFVCARQVHHKYGGEAITLTGNLSLTRKDAQYATVDPGGQARTITFPAEEGNEGLYFEHRNVGSAGEDLTYQTDGSVTVGVLSPGHAARFIVSAAGAWIMSSRAIAADADGLVAVANTDRVQRANSLSPRYELKWVAGQRGKPGINADIQNSAEATRMVADPDFEITGVNSTSALCTYYAEGGVTLTTAGADGDEMILTPHLDANQSPWTQVTWGTDKQVVWECHIKSGASVTNAIIWAGLKLTSAEAKATDDNQVFFRLEDDVASGNWEVVSSIGGTDTSTDSGTAGAVTTEYYLKIVIGVDRTAKCYLNGSLVYTTASLTDTTDLIPYIGVAADGAAAAKSINVFGQSISRVIG